MAPLNYYNDVYETLELRRSDWPLLVFSIVTLITLADFAIGQAPSNEALSLTGLYTCLGTPGLPEQYHKRKLDIVYQWQVYSGPAREANLDAIALKQSRSGEPLVLDIEKIPGTKKTLYADPRRDSKEDYRLAIDTVMSGPLRIMRARNVPVALFDRPSVNGLAHAWREPKLAEVFHQRVRDARPLLELQDFVVVQLYLPKSHNKIINSGKTWPVDHWHQRGKWFHTEYAKIGKPSLMFVSPTEQGIGSADYVDAEALRTVVNELLNYDIPVCIWGGHEKVFDANNPIWQAIADLIEENK